MIRIRAAARAALAVCALLPAAAACAQSRYPVRTVTLVTHSSPGGGSDVFLRTLVKHLGPKMGLNFAVENVSGGSGARAMAKVAQAPADGSMLYATTPTYIQTTILSRPSHGYDSLMPVVNVFYDPEVIYTRTAAPFTTLAEAVERARKNPGKARWGASNPASLERIAMERMNRLAHAGAIVVSHEGGRDQMLNVLNGTCDIGIGEVQELRAQLESGQVRLLAVLADRRLADLPGLATAKEQGVDLTVTKFRGLAGPRNLPLPVLNAWDEGIRAVLADPAYRKAVEHESLIAAPMGYAEAATFTAGFAADVRRSFRDLGIVR